MQAKDLVITMLKHSDELHPTYTKEQHLIWALGMLADAVVEQNQKDNMVISTLKQRIAQLYTRRYDH
jgi:hypothetical protein